MSPKEVDCRANKKIAEVKLPFENLFRKDILEIT
jgi:hypothetical protein